VRVLTRGADPAAKLDTLSGLWNSRVGELHAKRFDHQRLGITFTVYQWKKWLL